MNALRIMITSGGGPGVWGLLAALRTLPGRTAHVIVNDPAPHATLGTRLADQAVRLPDAQNSHYVDELLTVSRRARVDLLIPVYDGELRALVRRRDDFAAAGTRVLLAPTAQIELCLDKAATHAALRGADLTPPFALARTLAETAHAISRLGYPHHALCVRPLSLAGGRGVHQLHPDGLTFEARLRDRPGFARCRAEEFLRWRSEGPDDFPLLLTPWLDGPELGFDLLAENGRVLGYAVRRKSGPNLHGNPTGIEFREAPGEARWLARLTAKLTLSGLLSIDAMYDSDQRLRLLEINPRPGAYLGLTCARVHLLARAIDRLLGEEREPHEYELDLEIDAGLRVFADLALTRRHSRLLPLTAPVDSEPSRSHADARCLSGRTSG